MPRPMRIALFTGNYNYVREGANQALNRAVSHVERNGHQVRVYSPVTRTPAFEPAGTLVPVRSIALPVRSEFRLGLGLPRAVRRDLIAFAPDLVHVSTPDISGMRAQSFARRRNLPVVASLHTRFEAYLEHYGLGKARPAAEALLRRFYRRSDHILVPTDDLRSAMIETVGHERVSVWSRGVDRELFDPARRDTDWRRRHGWGDGDPVVLFFGRLVREKGVDAFIAAIRRLQGQGHRVGTLIVGEGPDRRRFKALPGAVLTGHLDGVELARAVASADILLHTSRTETFGNVLLEAMASGLAVVSADVPSARMLLDQGRRGLLSASDDPDAFAGAVASLVESPEQRRRLGVAARAASAAFSWEAASRSVERAYLETLRRS